MGSRSVLRREIRSKLDFADLISEGVPIRAAKNLQKYISVSDIRMAELIAVSPKTYHARRTHLKMDEGSRVYTIVRVVVEAEKSFGSKDEALRWLKAVQPALGGHVPIKMLRTSAGVQVVGDLLDRIEFGVYRYAWLISVKTKDFYCQIIDEKRVKIL